MQHFKELTGTLSILPGNLLTKIYKFIRDIFSFHVTTGDSVAKSSISTSEELYFLQPPSLGGAATIFPSSELSPAVFSRPSSFFPQRMLFARMSPPGLSIMAVQGLPTCYVRISRGRASKRQRPRGCLSHKAWAQT